MRQRQLSGGEVPGGYPYTRLMKGSYRDLGGIYERCKTSISCIITRITSPKPETFKTFIVGAVYQGL